MMRFAAENVSGLHSMGERDADQSNSLSFMLYVLYLCCVFVCVLIRVLLFFCAGVQSRNSRRIGEIMHGAVMSDGGRSTFCMWRISECYVNCGLIFWSKIVVRSAVNVKVLSDFFLEILNFLRCVSLTEIDLWSANVGNTFHIIIPLPSHPTDVEWSIADREIFNLILNETKMIILIYNFIIISYFNLFTSFFSLL